MSSQLTYVGKRSRAHDQAAAQLGPDQQAHQRARKPLAPHRQELSDKIKCILTEYYDPQAMVINGSADMCHSMYDVDVRLGVQKRFRHLTCARTSV